ncbi:hypothetical protein LTR86_007991 [Recurvomyces mirabilis]|nr:hypothetical protein LTR86_007991 [Recurvomyces mirabilis]
MNYANLLEEGRLKRGFVVATLVSTLVGTLTAGMTLLDKVQDKRAKAKQKGVDDGQNAQLQQLKAKIEKIETREQDSDDGSSSSRSSRRPHRRSRRSTVDREEELAYSVRKSRALIEREYEDNLMRVGRDYARGDLITENKLQAHIIQLQQTVINVLQEALYSGRRLTDDDMYRLANAQYAAREGSLEALQDQYHRMLDRRRPEEDRLRLSPAPGLPQKQLSWPVERPAGSREFGPPRRTRTLPSKSLFCRYSEDLQYSSSKGLHPAFDPGDDGRCPACAVNLDVRLGDSWVFRDKRINDRFVVKSHAEDGRFVCLICNRYSQVDCVCRDVDSLMRHITSTHTPEELEDDVDVEKVVRRGEIEYA